MPHFVMTVGSRTGEYPAYVEAESAEAAKSEFEKRNPGYTVREVEGREPRFGQVVLVGAGGGYGRWGSGDDLDAAKKSFRKHGGVLGGGYFVYTFDAETDFVGVNGMGSPMWVPAEKAPTVEEVKPR